MAAGVSSLSRLPPATLGSKRGYLSHLLLSAFRTAQHKKGAEETGKWWAGRLQKYTVAGAWQRRKRAEQPQRGKWKPRVDSSTNSSWEAPSQGGRNRGRAVWSEGSQGGEASCEEKHVFSLMRNLDWRASAGTHAHSHTHTGERSRREPFPGLGGRKG